MARVRINPPVPANQGPLRKVIDWYSNEREQVIEVYECGHHWPQKQDHYGPTNADRRRCWQCRDGVGVTAKGSEHGGST